jgi:dienelactone hydrolase
MRWTGEAEIALGVSERSFIVDREGDQITGSLWTPENAVGPVPLVLIGHGGRSERRNPNGLALARRIVRRHGMAVAAIDAIDHGQRGTPHTDDDIAWYIDIWKRPDTLDRMTADWKATLDALVELPNIDAGRVGYWGLSMGSMLGVPFVAAESRIKAAVLGLCGFRGSSAVRGRFSERHHADAPQITCPVLFVVQWDDELFDRDGAFELFDEIGTADKRLHANPGLHGEVPQEEVNATREFLAARLEARPQER